MGGALGRANLVECDRNRSPYRAPRRHIKAKDLHADRARNDGLTTIKCLKGSLSDRNPVFDHGWRAQGLRKAKVSHTSDVDIEGFPLPRMRR
jgi:hypothetical protein